MDTLYLQSFVNKYLFKLPVSIYTSILDGLPRTFIYYYVLRISDPEIRSEILDWYFNKDDVILDLIGNGGLFSMPKIRLITSVVTMVQLLQLPEFRPKELHIRLSMKNTVKAELNILMGQIDKLDALPNIKISIDPFVGKNLEPLDIEPMVRLSCMKSLSLYVNGFSIKITKFNAYLHKMFGELQSLQDLFLSLSPEWEDMFELPQSLTSLAIYESNINFQNVKLPKTLTKLTLSSCRLGDTKLQSIKWPRKLLELSLHDNLFTILPLSKFPQTLEVLDISLNVSIKTVEIDNNAWLPNLRELDASGCGINHEMFLKLIKNWPSKLSNLQMSWHKLTHTESLQGLPDSIEYLNLACLKPIYLNSDFKLPSSLKDLTITLQGYFSKLVIPYGVENLRISGKNLRFSDLELPHSLRLLNLYIVYIGNIDFLSSDRFPRLEELHLTHSGITSIDTWRAPTSLKIVKITRNPIKSLSKHAPLLNCAKLKELSFYNCQINFLEDGIQMPLQLRKLDLSFNKLGNSEKTDFKGVAVNLEGNPFTTIDFGTTTRLFQ
ncbi:uncharacterized protein RJT21DRAFT_28744 [Scheffersomyces amazonensis]|uniref:uncharacterized protein n=1 Tax=Scheffersomyces amazonensis TaxID=1078765 RepID=UPI00315D71D6